MVSRLAIRCLALVVIASFFCASAMPEDDGVQMIQLGEDPSDEAAQITEEVR